MLPDSKNEITVSFDCGTLLLKESGSARIPDAAIPFVRADDRVGAWRAQASDYSTLLRILHAENIPFSDNAREYKKLSLELHGGFTPMKHQKDALDAWRGANPPGRGVVSMPTGSGKSYLAVTAILAVNRSALVIAPTIDLVQQWAATLEKFFKVKVGMLGGGSREYDCDIVVSTYDSAVIFMEHIGNRFGIVVFDECHHLPGQVNRTAASMCIAPYRLGLSATPDRGDDGDAALCSLVGPKVFEIAIDELEGRVLAPYVTHTVSVELHPDEAEEYRQQRKIYTDFIRAHAINFSERDAWSRFLGLCARMPDGRKVMNAYLRQRAIARCGRGKLDVLWNIIRSHCCGRIIIFTADNDAAYDIGNALCLPVITHKTKSAERKDFLDRFRSGEYPVIVTSKVLNEGVDVPEASVGVVISGSGSTREHIQRLGRILRASEGKQAELFELVSANTGEVSVSSRRRNNRAYSGHGSWKWKRRS